MPRFFSPILNEPAALLVGAQYVVRVAAVCGSLAALGACAPQTLGRESLSSAPQLRAVDDKSAPFQFKDASASFSSYSKILIDPVSQYSGADAQFGAVSPADRQAIADYMFEVFSQTLGKAHTLTSVPGPDTLRLHLTLTGVETSTPLISAVSRVVPAGLAVNAGLAAAGEKGTFLGSISYAVEMHDAKTGRLLYAYVTTRSANALDISSSFGPLDATRAGARIGADELLARLAKLGVPAPGR